MTIADKPSTRGHTPGQSDPVHAEPVHAEPVPSRSADVSVWLIWAAVMLVAIAILPFAARSQDVVRAIATMCGFRLD
jgi:hypothetical protein